MKDIIINNELEINLNIEKEKTKQLELIKDIKLIEKNISQNHMQNNNDDSDTEYESDYICDSDSEDDDIKISNILKFDRKIKINNKKINNFNNFNKNNLCSLNIDSDIYKNALSEIDITKHYKI